MDAIVLVGGFGTRLLPLTKTLPKPLIPLANVPFVERTVAWLRAQGVDHVILSLHYNPEQFMAYFADRPLGVDISFAVEEAPLGTGGAIQNCARHVRSARCLVFNGDIFTDLDLRAMLAQHRHAGAQITIAVKRLADASRFGVIETDAYGRILTFTEKPPRELAANRLINAGVYIYEREVLAHFPAGPCSVERDIYPRLLDRNVPFQAYEEPCYWTDLGTPRDYLQAHRDILTRKVHLPLAARELFPGVWLGDRVSIADDAIIRPPVLFGDGAWIGANTSIGPLVVLGAGARVETEALVEDSIIWEGGRVSPGSTVLGSIVGRHAQLTGAARDVVCGDYEEVGA